MESVLIFVCLLSQVDKIDGEENGIKEWRE